MEAGGGWVIYIVLACQCVVRGVFTVENGWR